MKILAMGSSALMDGFALLGIKTYADESVEVINNVLAELKRNHERALIFMQQDLIHAQIPMVRQLQNYGGSILICEIPDLHQVDQYQPAVEKLIEKVLGASTLGSGHGH
ncbi:MAG: hypothetical protein H8E21_14165 [Gammaproteobacteria bacterium]|nr:hypothetical protein [Gammaproteobacteria bacterium]MBL6998392.1 hypothetical protein [Gammaproteobacteria bacterium]